MLARRRMSARQLARQLEVSPPWVSDRLTGQKEITLNDIEAIATELDTSIRELLGLDAMELPEELYEILAIVQNDSIPKEHRDQLLRVVRRIVPVWQEMRPVEAAAPRKRTR